MPKVAILSDIHSNIPAFEAVLEDVRTSGATEIYFGGDTVGYAASPDECVTLVRENGGKSVLGNHDYYTNAVISNPENIPADDAWVGNPVWAGVVHAARSLSEDNAAWLSALPGFLKIPGGILGHASLHFVDQWPYLHSAGDAAPTLDILEKSGDGLGFFGHTHQQTFFSHRQGNAIARRLGFSKVYLPEGVVCAVMVGSVGQPREEDTRAAWVLWDSDERIAEFRKTEYPALDAAQKIIDTGLPESSATRLLDYKTLRKLRRA